MADSRIYELPENVDVTGLSFICDKSGESSAQRLSVSYVLDKVTDNEAAIAENENNISDNATAIATKLDQGQVDTRIQTKMGLITYLAYSENESDSTVNPLTDVTEIINTNGLSDVFVNVILKDSSDYYYLDFKTSHFNFFKNYFVDIIPVYTGARSAVVDVINSGATLKFAFYDDSGNRKATKFQIKITRHV